jgi:DNA repair protein RadA/Sms
MFFCKICNAKSPIYKKYCPVCSGKDSMEKRIQLTEASNTVIQVTGLEHLPSGFSFFDSVFKGFLRTFIYFLTAKAGEGKTTFLLQVSSFLVSIGKKVLYFSFDESEAGIMKKCNQYRLNNNLPQFIFENTIGIVDRWINMLHPDFVIIDSLQSFAKYDSNSIVSSLFNFRNLVKSLNFAAIVIGEDRKDGKDYYGPTNIRYIIDVQMQLVKGDNDEVSISTPNKNRDTDDRTSRAFFKRTPTGLVEIKEYETGYLPRHSEKAKVGLASFVSKEGNEYYVDEITTVIIEKSAKKPYMSIAGMNLAKTNNLLALLQTYFTLGNIDIFLRANKTERLRSDAELACIIAVISWLNKTAISVDTVFIGGVDNGGYLLPVDGMEQQVKRAKALGYNRIIGPKASGSQTATWEEFETLESLMKALFQ